MNMKKKQDGCNRKPFDILGEIWQMSDYYSARHEKNDTPDLPRQSKGEYPIRYPSRGTFEESKRLGLFSAFRIGCDFWPNREKFDALDPDRELIQIDMLRSTTDYGRPENQALNLSYEEFTEKYCNAAFDYSLAHPGRVMLCAVGEIDSSHPWPKDSYFRTREEAYAFFKHNCFHTRIGSCDPESLYRLLQKRGLNFEQVNLMIHGACLFAIPYYFEWGFPHIEIERGLGTSLNMQVSLGYLRGAWKQFGRKSRWGIDFSTHQANYNQCSWYDEHGVRVGGFTESLIERCWLYSWFGGAEYLLCEGSDYTHWVFQKDGSFRLSKLGETARKFANFTLRSGIDRGEPVVPGTVLLDYSNGYEQEGGVDRMHPYVWGNKIPYSEKDTNIGCVYSAFFPGQEHICARTEHVVFPDCGYSTRQEYLKKVRHGDDMRGLEGGFLTPSPYGDSLDTLWDNAPLKVMREYKVLIPAGTARLPADILDEYVRQGGTLAASVDRLTPDMLRQLGIELLPSLASDWEYDRITLTDGSFSSDGLRYVYRRMKFQSAKILASNTRGVPIVAEIPFGDGKVLLCTVPYGQDISGSSLIGVWAHVIGNEVKKHFPVEFDSKGILEIAVNRTEAGYLLGLFNNTPESWSGTIRIKGLPELRICREVYPEKRSVETSGNSFVLELEPYSVRIIEVE